MYETILVPTAGGPGTERAIEYAVNEAQSHDASIQLLTVKDDGTSQLNAAYGGESESELEEQAKDAIQSVREQIPEEISVDSFITNGVPKDEILAHAETYDVDIIVMATHGRTGIQRYLIGSTTESVVRHSDIPVLTVRTADTTQG